MLIFGQYTAFHTRGLIGPTNNLLRKIPTSSVVAGPPIFMKTIAVGPFEDVASCVTGGTTVAMARACASGCCCRACREYIVGEATHLVTMGEDEDVHFESLERGVRTAMATDVYRTGTQVREAETKQSINCVMNLLNNLEYRANSEWVKRLSMTPARNYPCPSQPCVRGRGRVTCFRVTYFLARITSAC